jgi:hypothetical protein
VPLPPEAAWTSHDAAPVLYAGHRDRMSLVDPIRTWSIMDTMVSLTTPVLVVLASLVV